jgi:hypothetical protein
VSLGTTLGLIVSILVLFGTAILGLLRFKHERQLADQADARKVLADAARELWRMKQAMRDQFGALGASLGTGDWPEDFLARIGKLEVSRDAVEGGWTYFGFASRRSKQSLSHHEAQKQNEVFDDRREEYLAAAEKAAGVGL